MRWALLALTAAVFVACGGGDDGGAPDDPESAMEQYARIVLRQQGGRAYEFLLPEQAARIPRDTFIGCIQEGEGAPADVEIEATDAYQEMIDVAEVGEIETWAVTLEVTSGDDSFTATRHLVERDGRFYTFYGPEDVAAFAAGECP